MVLEIYGMEIVVLTGAIRVLRIVMEEFVAPMDAEEVVVPVRRAKHAALRGRALTRVREILVQPVWMHVVVYPDAAPVADAYVKVHAGDVFKIKKSLMKIRTACIIIVFFFLVSACIKENRLKELAVYKTIYTCRGDTCDSSVVLLEHFFFDEDSVVTKYINNENQYYFLAEFDRKTDILKKQYYTLDDHFMYEQNSRFNTLGLETKIEYYDSVRNLTYTVVNTFYDQSNLKKKQRKIFRDGTLKEIQYTYDDRNNLTSCLEVSGQDIVVTEQHRMSYNDLGKIIKDTIEYPGGQKIIENVYRGDKLFYRIEKNSLKDASGVSSDALYKEFMKVYYLYNTESDISEIRNIRIFPDTKTFKMDSRIEFTYSDNHLVKRKAYFNSNDQKVYSIDMEYTF